MWQCSAARDGSHVRHLHAAHASSHQERAHGSAQRSMQVVEGKLGETWKQLTRARMLRFRKPEERSAQRTLMRVLLLINRMLVFVQRYLHFVTVEVIDPQWHVMMSRIADAASIDEVCAMHAACCVLSERSCSLLPTAAPRRALCAARQRMIAVARPLWWWLGWAQEHLATLRCR